jgi:hypothetical protein
MRNVPRRSYRRRSDASFSVLLPNVESNLESRRCCGLPVLVARWSWSSESAGDWSPLRLCIECAAAVSRSASPEMGLQ